MLQWALANIVKPFLVILILAGLTYGAIFAIKNFIGGISSSGFGSPVEVIQDSWIGMMDDIQSNLSNVGTNNGIPGVILSVFWSLTAIFILVVGVVIILLFSLVYFVVYIIKLLLVTILGKFGK